MPLPKAGSLKKKTRGKKRTTAILTDTPEKNAIEEQSKKKPRPRKLQLAKIKNMKRAAKKQTKSKGKKSDENGHDCRCLICTELYSDSRPNESWIQCCKCKGWAHEECVQIAHDEFFICDICQE